MYVYGIACSCNFSSAGCLHVSGPEKFETCYFYKTSGKSLLLPINGSYSAFRKFISRPKNDTAYLVSNAKDGLKSWRTWHFIKDSAVDKKDCTSSDRVKTVGDNCYDVQIN